jgi:Virus neck protein
MQRKLGNFNPIYNEDDSSYYDNARLIDMYIKNSDKGFGGLGDVLGNAGLEINDTITFVVARRTFINEIGDYNDQVRPLEGDLIYFPLNRKIFKIMFVEHESIFYQTGSLQVWELNCELFSYSGEDFDTGIPDIDDLYDGINNNAFDFGLALEGADEVLLAIEGNGLPLLLESDDTTLLEQLGADNNYIESEGNKIIDFSCMDPFTQGDDY